MAQKKSIEEKLLSYISKPRKGEWVSAKVLSKYLKIPLEHMEFYICIMTDAHIIEGVRDKGTGEYWLRHIWQKPSTRQSIKSPIKTISKSTIN